VCVPKILDVLKEHVLRIDPAAVDPPKGLSIPARWWRYRKIHRMFGLKFWAFIVGAAPLGSALEDYWKRLGFVVIQGYGLTETAPIVTMNHPFKTNTGSVGKPIAGVEVKIADDGEILVRGEDVTTGEYEKGSGVGDQGSGAAGRTIDEAGWLHTGDIGEKDAEGRLFIRGRKKEMIVTPEGLNVFPDDVERPLNAQKGVIESAVVAARAAEVRTRATEGAESSDERVHAVLRLDPGVDAETVIRNANSQLADHQRIRSFSIWTNGLLPRTEGTKKLKRAAIKQWVDSGATPAAASGGDQLQTLLAKFAGARQLDGGTSIEGLGLSSLERVELMVALEDQFQTRIDETRFAGAKTLDDLRAVIASAPQDAEVAEPVDFPSWNRRWIVRIIRRISQATWILPLGRIFAWVRVSGLEHRGRDRARRVRVEPSKPFRRAGDPDCPAGKDSRDDRAGDGEGILQGAFLPGRLLRAAGVHKPVELLPVGLLLQHLPVAAARSRRAANAALHRRGHRRRVLGADFSGRRALGERQHEAVPRRHRDDRLQARPAGRSGPDRWGRSRPAHQLEMAQTGAGLGDVRSANAFIRRQLRGSCAAGGAGGT